MARTRPCPYCGYNMVVGTRRAPTVDHVVPRSRGGRLDDGNKLIVCATCNDDKGSMEIETWCARLTLNSDPRAARVAGVLAARTVVTATWPNGGGNLSSALRAT